MVNAHTFTIDSSSARSIRHDETGQDGFTYRSASADISISIGMWAQHRRGFFDANRHPSRMKRSCGRILVSTPVLDARNFVFARSLGFWK